MTTEYCMTGLFTHVDDQFNEQGINGKHPQAKLYVSEVITLGLLFALKGGRLVHFDEKIEKAKQARTQAIKTIRESLNDVASSKGVDLAKIQSASEIIAESILRNMDAMVSLTRIKKHDPYTAVHCINVCTLVEAMGLAGHIEQDKLPMIVTATMLHDIGKTMVPLKILNKPGPFESHELEEMRRHALYSGEILREAGGGLRRGDSHCHPAPRDDGRHWLSPGAKR